MDESSGLGTETIGGIGREMALRFRRYSSGEHVETSSTCSASPVRIGSYYLYEVGWGTSLCVSKTVLRQ